MDSRNLAYLDENGMPSRIIDLHQSRIKNWLLAQQNGEDFLPISVVDTLRIDNGGMLALADLPADNQAAEDYIGFIPAAGASSRYYKSLRNELPKKNAEFVASLAGVALPSEVKAFTDGSIDFKTLEAALDRPKALQPCTVGHETFLEAKIREMDQLASIARSVFVAPHAKSEQFVQLLPGIPRSKPVSFLEQGPRLSTIRYKTDGTAYLDADGNVSIVPGGHGTLKNLFKDLCESYPDSQGVLIANIDNIFGSSPEVVAAAEQFLAAHRFVLGKVKIIRKHLTNQEYPQANEVAGDLCRLLKPLPWEQSILSAMAVEVSYKSLMECLVRCFHLSLDSFVAAKSSAGSVPKAIAKLFHRPVNFLGQVKAKGGEVGGTAVRAKTPLGQISLCLELPHFSAEDHQSFLADPLKATHFNPVFVAAELVDPDTHYPDDENPFWLVAKKTFKGTEVIYHETILYEILGNSHFSNVVFPEIPRILFNPHKSYTDTKDRQLSHWFPRS